MNILKRTLLLSLVISTHAFSLAMHNQDTDPTHRHKITEILVMKRPTFPSKKTLWILQTATPERMPFRNDFMKEKAPACALFNTQAKSFILQTIFSPKKRP